MELVSSNKLAAVADFLANDEVFGIAPCSHFNISLKRDRVDVPCDVGDCDGDCPFYSKENFIKWIKEPNMEREFVDLKKPKIEALEEYCNDLEDVLADTEYDLADEECTNRELCDALEKIRGVLDGSR